VAVPWIVLSSTGSATAAGLVAAAGIGPLVLSALFGGALVDRWGHRRLSVAADALNAGAVAAIPLLEPSPFVLALLVALGAVFKGPGMAAREALRPAVARMAGWSLIRMNSRGEAVDGVSLLAGPAIAGLGIAAIGATATLWFTVSLFAVAALLTRVTVPGPPPPAPTAGSSSPSAREAAWSGANTGYLADVRAGLVLVLGDPALRGAALVSMVLVAVLVPIEAVVLPAHLQASGDAAGLALLLSAFGGGGVVGALATARLELRLGRRRTVLVSIATITVSVLGLALLPPLPLAAALAAVAGAASGPVGPLVAVMLQERTPEAARGRVIGTVASLSLAASPAALLLAGPLVDAAGPAGALCVLGAVCGLVLLPAARAWRHAADVAVPTGR